MQELSVREARGAAAQISPRPPLWVVRQLDGPAAHRRSLLGSTI